MPLDHVGLWVPGAQLQRTLDFYSAALSPIGYRILLRPVPHAAGFGRDAPDFWIAGKEGEDKGVGGVHVAFSTMSTSPLLHEALFSSMRRGLWLVDVLAFLASFCDCAVVVLRLCVSVCMGLMLRRQGGRRCLPRRCARGGRKG